MKYDEVDFYLIDLKSRFDKIKPNRQLELDLEVELISNVKDKR